MIGSAAANDNNDISFINTNSSRPKTDHSITFDPISLSALIIGLVAIVMGTANLLYFNKLKRQFEMSTTSSPLEFTMSLDDKVIA